MLNDRAIEALNVMLKNMRKIDKKLQPENGTDSDLNKTLRVMAQCLAVLIKIRLEEDEAMKAAVANLDQEAERLLSGSCQKPERSCHEPQKEDAEGSPQKERAVPLRPPDDRKDGTWTPTHTRIFTCPRCGKVRNLSTNEEDIKKKNEKEAANDNPPAENQ